MLNIMHVIGIKVIRKKLIQKAVMWWMFWGFLGGKFFTEILGKNVFPAFLKDLKSGNESGEK